MRILRLQQSLAYSSETHHSAVPTVSNMASPLPMPSASSLICHRLREGGKQQGQCLTTVGPPKATQKMRILDSGPKVQDKGGSRNHGFGRIPMFMLSFGSQAAFDPLSEFRTS